MADDWSRAQNLEALYLSGVRANLERRAGELAADVAGEQGATLLEPRQDSQREEIRDLALLSGMDPAKASQLPTNGELYTQIDRGDRTVLHVFVKSFAASHALRAAARDARPGREPAEARAYVEGKLALAGSIPCVFSLFAPAGWSEDVRLGSLAGEPHRVVLCSVADAGSGELWFDLVGEGLTWPLWLTLTPMGLARRVAWCQGHLRALFEREGRTALELEVAAAPLGLPPAVAARLVEEACKDPRGPFRLARMTNGKPFVRYTK